MNTWITYYTSSNGQPSNNNETHSDFDSALESWRSNCGAVQARGGGASVLKNEKEEELVWLEHIEGGYVTGLLSLEYDLDQYDQEDIDTSEKVYNKILNARRGVRGSALDLDTECRHEIKAPGFDGAPYCKQCGEQF